MLSCAAGVEISKRDVMQFARDGLMVTHFFDGQFCLAVRIDWIFGRIFGDGQFVGYAVNRGGAAEDKFADARRFHCAKKHLGIGDVVLIVLEGIGYGFARLDERGEVHHGFDFMFFEGCGQQVEIRQIAFDKLASFYCGRVSLAEIVVNNWLMSFGGQHCRHIASDVPGSAGDEYSHLFCSFLVAASCFSIRFKISVSNWLSLPRSVQVRFDFCSRPSLNFCDGLLVRGHYGMVLSGGVLALGHA